MTDYASLVLAIDSTASDKAEKSLVKLEAASKKVEKSTSDLKTSTSNAWATMNTFSAAEDAAADKAWALANGYKEVGGQLIKATEETAKQAGMMTSLGLNTQFARRELMTLGKEAVTGDFGRLPKTFGTLVTHSNILPALISPIGLAVAGVTAAAAIGATVWYEWGKSAEEASKRVHDAADAAGKDAKAAWANVKKTIDEEINVVKNQLSGATGQLDAAIARRNAVTGTTKAGDAMAIGQEVISRREQIIALERNLNDLIKQRQDAQDKLDKKQGADNLKRINELEKIAEQHAKEYAHAQAVQRITDTEIAGNIQLTESQKKIVELYAQQEQGVLKLTDAEFNRQIANLATIASSEVAAYEYKKQQEEMAKASNKAAKESQKHWETFADNTQRTMSDVFFNGMTGKYTDIEQAFMEMLKRMLANAAAARLSEAIFGNNGKSGSSSNGWIGAIASMFSFDGGGSTGSGNRTGGVDGKGGFPAIVHPNETVIDHTKGQSAGGGITLVDNTTINIDSRADRQQVMTDVSKLIEGKQAQLVDRLQRQGALA